ncbi:MAG: hypothetical protein LBB29_02800 [Holosporaceae bacterium]|jgi:hypothetical protein|nr:hypothetical protein [Holosporaceae bacterium]
MSAATECARNIQQQLQSEEASFVQSLETSLKELTPYIASKIQQINQQGYSDFTFDNMDVTNKITQKGLIEGSIKERVYVSSIEEILNTILHICDHFFLWKQNNRGDALSSSTSPLWKMSNFSKYKDETTFWRETLKNLFFVSGSTQPLYLRLFNCGQLGKVLRNYIASLSQYSPEFQSFVELNKNDANFIYSPEELSEASFFSTY